MRALSEREDLILDLVVDPGLDQLFGEHAAFEEEGVVLPQRLEGLGQCGGQLRDALRFLRRQLVEVLVDRRQRLDAVLDAIDSRHELRGEGEVRVRRRVGRAELEALRLRVGTRERDPDGRRAVAGRVDEVDRRLVALHEPVVRVDRRVGEGEDSGRVGEETADVPARDIGQLRVALFVEEEGLAVEPQRLVGVHAGAVVAEDGLGHEGGGLAPLVSGVLHDVLELQDVVGGVHHRVELVVDLGLAGGADLVMGTLQIKAHLDEVQRDVVTQVGLLVDGRHREISALRLRLITEVAAFLLAGAVPRGLDGVDLVEAPPGADLVAHIVKDVELGLGGEERGVGDAGRGEILLGLLRHLSRILRVDLAVARVVDVEDHHERLVRTERVDVRRCDVGDQLHV